MDTRFSVPDLNAQIASFFNSSEVSDQDRAELEKIIKMFEEIHSLEDANEKDEVSIRLYKKLHHCLDAKKFVAIRNNKKSLDDVLYDATLTLAWLHPINPTDFYTACEIEDENKLVMSDRYQYDIQSMVLWIKQGKCINPFTKQMFTERDQERILDWIKVNTGERLAFVSELQNPNDEEDDIFAPFETFPAPEMLYNIGHLNSFAILTVAKYLQPYVASALEYVSACSRHCFFSAREVNPNELNHNVREVPRPFRMHND